MKSRKDVVPFNDLLKTQIISPDELQKTTTVFHFDCSCYGSEELEALFDLLKNPNHLKQTHHHITEISFSQLHADIEDEIVQKIADCVKDDNSIKTIRFSDNNVTDKSREMIADAVQNYNYKITNVILGPGEDRHEKINDALNDALTRNRRIESGAQKLPPFLIQRAKLYRSENQFHKALSDYDYAWWLNPKCEPGLDDTIADIKTNDVSQSLERAQAYADVEQDNEALAEYRKLLALDRRFSNQEIHCKALEGAIFILTKDTTNADNLQKAASILEKSVIQTSRSKSGFEEQRAMQAQYCNSLPQVLRNAQVGKEEKLKLNAKALDLYNVYNALRDADCFDSTCESLENEYWSCFEETVALLQQGNIGVEDQIGSNEKLLELYEDTFLSMKHKLDTTRLIEPYVTCVENTAALLQQAGVDTQDVLNQNEKAGELYKTTYNFLQKQGIVQHNNRLNQGELRCLENQATFLQQADVGTEDGLTQHKKAIDIYKGIYGKYGHRTTQQYANKAKENYVSSVENMLGSIGPTTTLGLEQHKEILALCKSVYDVLPDDRVKNAYVNYVTHITDTSLAQADTQNALDALGLLRTALEVFPNTQQLIEVKNHSLGHLADKAITMTKDGFTKFDSNDFSATKDDFSTSLDIWRALAKEGDEKLQKKAQRQMLIINEKVAKIEAIEEEAALRQEAQQQALLKEAEDQERRDVDDIYRTMIQHAIKNATKVKQRDGEYNSYRDVHVEIYEVMRNVISDNWSSIKEIKDEIKKDPEILQTITDSIKQAKPMMGSRSGEIIFKSDKKGEKSHSDKIADVFAIRCREIAAQKSGDMMKETGSKESDLSSMTLSVAAPAPSAPPSSKMVQGVNETIESSVAAPYYTEQQLAGQPRSPETETRKIIYNAMRHSGKVGQTSDNRGALPPISNELFEIIHQVVCTHWDNIQSMPEEDITENKTIARIIGSSIKQNQTMTGSRSGVLYFRDSVLQQDTLDLLNDVFATQCQNYHSDHSQVSSMGNSVHTSETIQQRQSSVTAPDFVTAQAVIVEEAQLAQAVVVPPSPLREVHLPEAPTHPVQHLPEVPNHSVAAHSATTVESERTAVNNR